MLPTILFVLLTFLCVSDVSSAQSQWPIPRGDQSGTGTTAIQLADELTELWSYQAEEAIEATPVVAEDRVFVADVMGRLTAIDFKTGQRIWSKNYDTGFVAAAAVQTAADDRRALLVIGDVEGNLYALDPETGKEKWTAQTDGQIDGAAAFYEDGVLVTSQDGKLYRFAQDDGSPTWVYETQDQIRCGATIAGDQTFLGGCDGRLHVVDLKSGQLAGEPMPLSGPTGSTVAVRGERAVLPTMDGMIFAFRWQDGELLWRTVDEDRPQEYRSSAAVTENLVILSSQNKSVDALDLVTGKPVWQYKLRRRADASPVVAGDDVWIAATDGRLVRLSLKDGTEKSITEFRGALIASPAVADDSLIVADDDGVVRRLGPKRH